MTLDHVMTKDLITIGMDDTLARVRELFNEHNFHHLLVVENGKLLGLVSDRDLLKNVSPFIGKITERSQDKFLLQRKVHQIMKRQLISAGPKTPIKDGVVLMLAHRVDSLPVVDEEGRCVGIVTGHDLLRYFLECGIEPPTVVSQVASAAA